MDEKKFVVVFKKSPDFRTYPVQVIFGGAVPDGSGIIMNFGIDHNPTPNYVEHPVSADGKVDLGKIEQIAQVGNIERELFGALFLSIDQAKKTIEWLKKNVDLIEGARHE